MEDELELQVRVAELEARLAFLEESQHAGQVGSWRAQLGPASLLELTDEGYRVLGVAPGTALRNIDLYQMLHPEDRDRFLAAIVEVRTGGGRGQVETRILDADGSERVILITAATAPGESRETGAVTGTMADITGRRTAQMDIELRDRIAAESELRRAIDEGELFLEYQPILSLDHRGFRGAEALVRWQHPERGRLEPIEFVGFAEESGLILLLGQWVLAAACAELRRWLEAGVRDDFVMSINLSAVQLHTGSLPTAVAQALTQAGVPGARVLLEVTESVLVKGTLDDHSLRAIRDLGVQIAIDDFGTKYSTLDYLARLPVDALKIDAAFVQAIDDRPGRAVVEAIAALGRALGLHVTAEGVETDEQLAVVRDAGCNAAQGFLISRPLPGDECLAFLTR